jgi:hypothetical protein
MTTNDPAIATGARLAGARIQQLTILIGDRLGALHRALRALESRHIRICALTILESTDHAVVRLVVDRPRLAARLLEQADYRVYRSRLLGVALPRRAEGELGVRGVLQTLLSAEVKVDYAYSLVCRVEERSVLALSIEDMQVGENALAGAGLELVDQAQLGWGGGEATS